MNVEVNLKNLPFLLISYNLPPKKNLKLSSEWLRRIFRILRGAFLAACGGEMRSD